MKFTTAHKKGAGILVAGLVGVFTGQFLPPEIFTTIIDVFV